MKHMNGLLTLQYCIFKLHLIGHSIEPGPISYVSAKIA